MEVAKLAGIPEIEAAARAGVMTDEAISQVVNGKKVTLTKAYQQWDRWMTMTLAARTRVNNAMYFNSFANHISKGKWNTAINTIKPEQIDEWVNSGGKKGTRRVRLAALRSFWKWANAEGVTSRDPSKLVKVKMDDLTHEQKETKKRDRVISDDEYRSIVDLYNEKGQIEWGLACVIARNTGLRMGDILNLEWDCFTIGAVVDKDVTVLFDEASELPKSVKQDGFVESMAVWTDKRDKRVELPVKGELAYTIQKYWEVSRGEEYVFQFLRDDYNDPKKRAYLSRLFSRHCKKLGIEATFHDWRHTYATDCRAKGMDMPHIASNLGHSSTTTTEIYVDQEKADNVIPMPKPSVTDMLSQIKKAAGVG